MAQWNVKTSNLFILSCVVFLMLLILVLPDVDLPDTAFHRGTAPSVLHAQATAAPAAVTVAAVFQFSDAAEACSPSCQTADLVASPDPNSLPILLRSIRC
jgi:hypothetical protein